MNQRDEVHYYSVILRTHALKANDKIENLMKKFIKAHTTMCLFNQTTNAKISSVKGVKRRNAHLWNVHKRFINEEKLILESIWFSIFLLIK